MEGRELQALPPLPTCGLQVRYSSSCRRRRRRRLSDLYSRCGQLTMLTTVRRVDGCNTMTCGRDAEDKVCLASNSRAARGLDLEVPRSTVQGGGNRQVRRARDLAWLLIPICAGTRLQLPNPTRTGAARSSHGRRPRRTQRPPTERGSPSRWPMSIRPPATRRNTTF